MSVVTIGTASVVLLLAAAPAGAKPCCSRTETQASTMTDCAQHEHSAAAPVATAADQPSTRRDSRDQVRQTMTVWFHKPVKIGDRILFGRYFIEHDNNRMARGWPCTYIYAAADPRLPVVAFHCTHLKRPMAAAPTLVMRPLGEANGLSELLAFQFAGETAGHGVPASR